jgi:hypothetical protein
MKHYFVFVALFLFSCGNDNTKTSDTGATGTAQVKGANTQQLNLTILLDLSDRIDPKTNPDKPEHYERDLQITKYLAEYFVKEMEKKGTYMAKGKMKVIFHPKPQDPNINVAVEKLDINLAGMDTKQKKEVHDNLVNNVTGNLSGIYQSTIKQNKWIGSDIWRFFKNDVTDYAVEKDLNYRNVLVILTDGYIYHEDSKEREANRYAYLTSKLFDQYKLRNNTSWASEMEKQDFGLITKRHDLQNLEVLVLEVSPSAGHKDDEDIIKTVLSKWFDDMKVKRSAVYNSDLPEYTKKRIDNFLN